MKIAEVTPRASGLPRLLTFQCLDCKEVITIGGRLVYFPAQN